MAIRYWLVVHPLDRARELMELGALQVPWGERGPLDGMRESDGVVLYSPRESNPDGEPLRSAVGVGYLTSNEPRQWGSQARSPWRHDVEWMQDPAIAPIRPLRDMLELTRDDRFWGERLRDGWLEISRRDFEIFEDAVRRPSPNPSGYMLRTLRQAGYPDTMPGTPPGDRPPPEDRPRLIR